MAAAARVCQDQQPFLERRIAFHLARGPALLAPPPGIEPLNPGVSAPPSAPPDSPHPSKLDDPSKGVKRSWEESSASSSKPSPDNVSASYVARPQRIGAGLSNLGNTCFLNSVLQCLTYTQPLADSLNSGQHKLSCRKVGFCAMCALESHVKAALQSWGKVIAPNHIVKNLRSISRAFQPWRQEDAHEFLRYLLEALQKDCLPSKTPMNSPEQEKSLLYKIFGGRLRSQVKCTNCLEHSETFDPFLDLSLDITRADTLGKALARFTANEILDGDNKYHCEKCNKKVRAIKRFTIETAPNVLTVQFKRFSSTGLHGQKIDKKVHFERKLDITPFMGNTKVGAVYDLYGVLVHAGWSTRSGHYYCFVRTSSDMWHVLDDSRVQQLSEQAVLNQKAYILFYIRKPLTQKQIATPSSEIPWKKSSAAKPLFVPPIANPTMEQKKQDSQGEAAATVHINKTSQEIEGGPPPKSVESASSQKEKELKEEMKVVAKEENKESLQQNEALQAEAEKQNPEEKEFSAPAMQKCASTEREPKSVAETAAIAGTREVIKEKGKPDKRAPEKLENGRPESKKLDGDSLRKHERGYLKLLRAMPRNRRLLMEKALEHEHNENGEAGHICNTKQLGSNEPNKPKKAVSKNTPVNELFGAEVARWDGVDDGKGVVVIEHKAATKRPNEWDEEYDRGRLKKSKRNAERFGDGSANPFQALISRKQS